MPKRKICVVVTARPSYSRMKTALQAIKEHPDLELQLVVAASALLSRYGNAYRFMERDGFTIAARVFNVLEGENLLAQAKTTGLGIIELTNVFEHLQPDAVITIADRFETISTAIAAAYMNIPLVHIQGGEVTGNIDEKVRHAITKLADLHLVASHKARERVIKMGEDPEKVFLTGCPSIDIAREIREDGTMDFDPYERYGGVGEQPNISDGYIVVMQHPVTTEYRAAKEQVSKTLQAVNELQVPTFWFWPNVDAGADGTSNAIRAFREQHQPRHIHFFKNMDPLDFLKVLKNGRCIVGNSSVGIRECSYLGIPAVNIGTRQNGRERGRNVLDTEYSVEAIKEAIQQQIDHGHYTPDDIYGDGRAGCRIGNLLADVPLSFHKVLQY
ncbi:UDP-N-acetylglucosamine 2-epimerase [Flavilitoribacter nigricans]|uniref:UDP-N-acetylglucosamine 2-epimerase (Hydrolyzing) n=1 Tax=Flavilitoribacter nigricans (strain ATCC 23147 / DSM 23189 / NBRC 102662 / NCIMB 1420 / SS-2) TaxID=1122177 RepID=A0A2D0NJC4_FLAN2|nr:UDP-N-acetylglucosamine 2-epimerase [Flavilitoribacter nigricans]PHN08605.1 UDP-N-acetylglucosamine 2-epimerase (hydrolyzing) [Flavilitoribacter nigricans DSM 23189 = NBRC 102662]